MINSGVAFGWWVGISGWVIGLALGGLIIVAVKTRELWSSIGLGLMILGGSGNLMSRVIHGGVVDNWNFLGLFYNNIWDYLIVGGVLIYGYTHFVRR